MSSCSRFRLPLSLRPRCVDLQLALQRNVRVDDEESREHVADILEDGKRVLAVEVIQNAKKIDHVEEAVEGGFG